MLIKLTLGGWENILTLLSTATKNIVLSCIVCLEVDFYEKNGAEIWNVCNGFLILKWRGNFKGKLEERINKSSWTIFTKLPFLE